MAEEATVAHHELGAEGWSHEHAHAKRRVVGAPVDDGRGAGALHVGIRELHLLAREQLERVARWEVWRARGPSRPQWTRVRHVSGASDAGVRGRRGEPISRSFASTNSGRPGYTPAGSTAGELMRRPVPPLMRPTLSRRTVLTPPPMSSHTTDAFAEASLLAVSRVCSAHQTLVTCDLRAPCVAVCAACAARISCARVCAAAPCVRRVCAVCVSCVRRERAVY
jgi:hypothetical protein